MYDLHVLQYKERLLLSLVRCKTLCVYLCHTYYTNTCMYQHENQKPPGFSRYTRAYVSLI